MYDKTTHRVLYALKKAQNTNKVVKSPKLIFVPYIYLQHYYVIYYLIDHVNTVNRMKKITRIEKCNNTRRKF